MQQPRTTITPTSPPGRFLIGHLGEFRRDILGFFERCAREHGDFVPLRMGPRRAFLVSRPDLIEPVMTADSASFRKPFIEALLRPLLGDALFIVEGEAWRRQRRAVQPAFARERVAGYASIAAEVAERTADGFRAGEVRDVHADMMRLTASVDSRAFLGLDLAGPGRVIAAANDAIMAYFAGRLTSLLPVPLWLPTPGNRKIGQALRDADRFIYDLIAQRRARPADHGDVLSQLLQARDEDGVGLSDRLLRDEILSLLVTGQEASAVALSWTLHLLSRHPDVDAALHAELESVLGGRTPTHDDLARLPYTEAVIQEALRLYPPFYFYGRDAVVDCKVGEHEVPADSSVLISPWVIQRDPRNFDEPDAFKPERWARDRPRPHKYAYFPFGGGSRACVASVYATMKATIILATIARRFRFAAVPGEVVTPLPVVTLRPKNGLKLKVVAR